VAAARPPPVGLLAFGASAAAMMLMAGPSVGVRDAGELTTAAFGVDVPHPTGFPLDMVLFRLAMLVPLGDVGFRANLAVALLMAGACALAAKLVYASAHASRPVVRAGCTALAPALLVASPTVLRAGTAVEVYALALLTTLLALLQIADDDAPLGPRVRTASLLAGLALAMHTTARPAALLATLVLVTRTPGVRARVRTGVTTLGGVLVGALGILYLPLAARRHGFVDWGDPSTPARLFRHLSAARIRAAYAHRILVPWRIPEDAARVGTILREDLGVWVLVLGVVGGVLAVRDRRVRWVAAVGAIDAAYAVLVNPMGVADRQTLFATEAALAVLAGYAMAWIAARVARAAWAFATVALGLGVIAGVRSDRSFAARADGWSATEILGAGGALGALPNGAIVLCESDDLCGVSLYAQRVEGERPDLTVLPRQHLADPSTWRRIRPGAIGTLPDERSHTDLRIARLIGLVETYGPRVRWEAGEIDDERIAHVALASGETPVLARIEGPVDVVDRNALAWLAPRVEAGHGARTVAAVVLDAAARRVARGGLDGAVPLWRAALRYDPDDPAAYTNLGVARSAVGDLTSAIALTEDALSIDPDRLTAWRNLARYRAAIGDAPGAIAAMNEYRRRGGAPIGLR
jgi:hypothetical protein